MPWITAKDRLPKDSLPKAARFKGRYTELRIREDGCISCEAMIFGNIEILEEWHPGTEWLDESEPDQEVLWDKVFEELDGSLGWDSQIGPYIPNKTEEKIRRLYTLIRK